MKNKYFYGVNEIYEDISDFIGNKSYNTFLLHSDGIKVPKSIFININFFDCYYNDIAEFNKGILEIQNYLKNNNFTNSLAIRSSALLINSSGKIIKEDSEALSMAGWFKSNLNVHISDIKGAIIDCYSIINSNILKQNIKNHFGDNFKIKIALLIQDFYEAQKSAVIFTKSPYSFNKGNFLINTTYGACHGIVSGEITGDAYWINRTNYTTIQKNISTKRQMYVNNTHTITLVDVPKQLQKKETLSKYDLNTLVKLGMSIEKIFNFPQDIELIYHPIYNWIVVQTRGINYWRIQNVKFNR